MILFILQTTPCFYHQGELRLLEMGGGWINPIHNIWTTALSHSCSFHYAFRYTATSQKTLFEYFQKCIPWFKQASVPPGNQASKSSVALFEVLLAPVQTVYNKPPATQIHFDPDVWAFRRTTCILVRCQGDRLRELRSRGRGHDWGTEEIHSMGNTEPTFFQAFLAAAAMGDNLM